MVIDQEVFVDNHGRKKVATYYINVFDKVPAKKGELLLLLPHPLKFNVKIDPCRNHFWKHVFFGKLSRVIFSSPIQNLVILRKENEVKFRRGKLTKFLLGDIWYIICGMYLWIKFKHW